MGFPDKLVKYICYNIDGEREREREKTIGGVFTSSSCNSGLEFPLIQSREHLQMDPCDLRW